MVDTASTVAVSAWSTVAAAIEAGWSVSWRSSSDPPTAPSGVGFLSWALDVETLQWILEHGPKAIMLSFGDPSPFANAVRDSSAKLIIQVTDLDEARRALEVGPDVIVVQGSETSRTASEHNESNWLPRGKQTTLVHVRVYSQRQPVEIVELRSRRLEKSVSSFTVRSPKSVKTRRQEGKRCGGRGWAAGGVHSLRRRGRRL